MCFLPQNASKQISERFLLFFAPENKILSCFLLRGMDRNGIPIVSFVFVPRYWIPSIFLFLGMVRNGIPRVCFYFVPQYRIPSIFLFRKIVWNGILEVFCSAEQPEFRRNKPFVSSIPSSAELFLSEIPIPTLTHVQIETQPSLPPTLLKIQSAGTHTHTGPYIDNWWSF